MPTKVGIHDFFPAACCKVMDDGPSPTMTDGARKDVRLLDRTRRKPLGFAAAGNHGVRRHVPKAFGHRGAKRMERQACHHQGSRHQGN
jgi:hypothetical protein